MSNAAKALQIAFKLHQAGHFQQAEEAYRKILRTDPRNVDALHLLGVLAHQTGRNDEAITYIGRAIAANGSQAVFHNNLGAAYRATGLLPEAQASFARAVQLSPDYADAHSNLGAVLHALGDLAAARMHYLRALQLKPDFAEACNNLGNVFRDEGQTGEALRWYEKSLQLRPDFPEALNNIGNVYQDQGDLTEAAAYYERAIRARPDYADPWNNLGNLLRDDGQWADAIACFEQALACGPNDGLRIKAALTTPVIAELIEDIARHRERIAAGIARLQTENLLIGNPVVEVGQTSLYLAYHGQDDRDLQAGLAAMFTRAAPSLAWTAPHCLAPAGVPTHGPTHGEPLRVGFISRHFHNHSNARLNVGLLKMLSRRDFRVLLFHFPGHDDAYAQFVRQSADEAVLLSTQLEVARRQIADQRLDILFYTDIGMDPLTYFLAFSRLAPVQCTTWGVPVTTGIPAVDYFISSADLEPEGAERHYTEQLVRLDNLPTYYYPPRAAAKLKTREALGFDPHAHLYVCPQSLFKIHPEFDAIIGEILRADQEGQVLLLSGPQEHWTEILTGRFSRTMPDVAQRVKFLPRQSSDDFLQLLATADVLLDPIHFGGGNTTYEALAFGTPIVTWPGNFMRGRVTYACYRKLGIMDCVAADGNEYVKIAVRLGTDPVWREEIRSRILAAKDVLFENPATVRELERFFTAALRQSHTLRKCG